MTGHEDRLTELAEKLAGTLAQCAQNPDVDAVHDTRTGTRRLEAALEALEQQQAPSNKQFRRAAERTRRLLKKVRRGAGEVRDLDVHRGLLGKLAPALSEAEGESTDQIQTVDAWLERHRDRHAARLRKHAAKWQKKLESRVGDLRRAIGGVSDRLDSGDQPVPEVLTPGALALTSFARLCADIPALHAANLHDFRKGAKHARYLTEAAEDDPWSQSVGKALKRIQDEIGDWHDWLLLQEEACAALDNPKGSELVAAIGRKRDKLYRSALRTAHQLRGRLMGEWMAMMEPSSPESATSEAGFRRAS